MCGFAPHDEVLLLRSFSSRFVLLIAALFLELLFVTLFELIV